MRGRYRPSAPVSGAGRRNRAATSRIRLRGLR